MSELRSDDFNRIEQFRVKPAPERQKKALRTWQGSVAVAVHTEDDATRVADAIKTSATRLASWDIPEVQQSDNIVILPNARYTARSANAYDAETFVRKAVGRVDALIMVDADGKEAIAVRTAVSLKLGPGR